MFFLHAIYTVWDYSNKIKAFKLHSQVCLFQSLALQHNYLIYSYFTVIVIYHYTLKKKKLEHYMMIMSVRIFRKWKKTYHDEHIIYCIKYIFFSCSSLIKTFKKNKWVIIKILEINLLDCTISLVPLPKNILNWSVTQLSTLYQKPVCTWIVCLSVFKIITLKIILLNEKYLTTIIIMLRIRTKFAQQCLILSTSCRVKALNQLSLRERCLIMYFYLNFMSLLIFIHVTHDVISTVVGKSLKSKIYQCISQINNWID